MDVPRRRRLQSVDDSSGYRVGKSPSMPFSASSGQHLGAENNNRASTSSRVFHRHLSSYNMNVNDPRTISLEQLMSNMFGSLESKKDIRQAFYNAIFLAATLLSGLVLFAVYKYALATFFRPLLWALLIGTILYPVKYVLTVSARRWLRTLQLTRTPLSAGIIILPFKTVDHILTLIGSVSCALLKTHFLHLLLINIIIIVYVNIDVVLPAVANKFETTAFVVNLCMNALKYVSETNWAWSIVICFLLATQFLHSEYIVFLQLASIPVWLIAVFHIFARFGNAVNPILLGLVILFVTGFWNEISHIIRSKRLVRVRAAVSRVAVNGSAASSAVSASTNTAVGGVDQSLVIPATSVPDSVLDPSAHNFDQSYNVFHLLGSSFSHVVNNSTMSSSVINVENAANESNLPIVDDDTDDTSDTNTTDADVPAVAPVDARMEGEQAAFGTAEDEIDGSRHLTGETEAVLPPLLRQRRSSRPNHLTLDNAAINSAPLTPSNNGQDLLFSTPNTNTQSPHLFASAPTSFHNDAGFKPFSVQSQQKHSTKLLIYLVWAVAYAQVWFSAWNLPLLFLPISYYAVRQFGFRFRVWHWMFIQGRACWQLCRRWYMSRKEILTPGPVRAVFRLLLKGDRKVMGALYAQMDTLSTLITLIGVVFLLVSGSIFIIYQVQWETRSLVSLSHDFVANSLEKHPKVNQWFDAEWLGTRARNVEAVVGTFYLNNRHNLTRKLFRQLGMHNLPNATQQNIEDELLRILDHVYVLAFPTTSTTPASAVAVHSTTIDQKLAFRNESSLFFNGSAADMHLNQTANKSIVISTTPPSLPVTATSASGVGQHNAVRSYFYGLRNRTAGDLFSDVRSLVGNFLRSRTSTKPAAAEDAALQQKPTTTSVDSDTGPFGGIVVDFTTLQTVTDTVFSILRVNVSIMLTLLMEVISLLFLYSSALLSFIVGLVVFATALYYLLLTSGEHYRPIVWVNKMAASIVDGEQQQAGLIVQEAVSSLFIASLKMAAFYGLYTWLTHTVFGVEVKFIPAVLAAVLAAVPVVSCYWACMPGCIDLILRRQSLLAAGLLFAAHYAPTMFVDALIYGEIHSSGHPYLLALSIVGGIAAIGLEGAIIGPMFLSVLVIGIDLYTHVLAPKYFSPTLTTAAAQQRDEAGENEHDENRQRDGDDSQQKAALAAAVVAAAAAAACDNSQHYQRNIMPANVPTAAAASLPAVINLPGRPPSSTLERRPASCSLSAPSVV